MKIVLLTKHNSYVGREYAQALKNAGITFSIVSLGEEDGGNSLESERCGGLWKPADWREVTQGIQVLRCPRLDSKEFELAVASQSFQLAIQGNVGEIVKKPTLSLFPDGILNFHPGALPEYRGCSAPEWQLYEDKPVYSTCHFLDEGIDTGDIIQERELRVNYQSYFHFRSGIYPETAKFMVEVVAEYLKNGQLESKQQNESCARYRKYIGEEKIEQLKLKLSSRTSILREHS